MNPGSTLGNLQSVGKPIADGINGAPRTAAETRPRNLAVMWCIKAWNAPVNQGNVDVAALQPLAGQATQQTLGVVTLATRSQVLEGLDDQAAVTSKYLKELRSGFLSEGLQISGGSQIVITHNLGYQPELDSVEFLWECIVAQAGWLPGDVFNRGTFMQDNTGTPSTTGFYAYAANATTLTVGCGASASLWYLPTKTTGVAVNMNLASWKFRVRIKP